jgi:hypothetical protein
MLYIIYKALGIKAKQWPEVLWCMVRHIQLSNDFAAWPSRSRHENLEHNRPCIQSRIQASIDLSSRVSNITVTPVNLYHGSY